MNRERISQKDLLFQHSLHWLILHGTKTTVHFRDEIVTEDYEKTFDSSLPTTTETRPQINACSSRSRRERIFFSYSGFWNYAEFALPYEESSSWR